VLGARPVSYPFNLLNICLVTDAGGGVGVAEVYPVEAGQACFYL